MPCSHYAWQAPGTKAFVQGKGQELQTIPVLQTSEGQGGAPLGPPQLAFPLTPNQTLGIEKETPGEGDDRGGDDAHSRSTPIFQPLVQPDLGT